MADIPGNVTTGATIDVGAAANDQLESVGDHDWFALQLTAGQQVAITLTGLTLQDPHLRVRDSAGNVVFENDDIRPDLIFDSRTIFTATSAGIYYVDVGGSDETESGTYELKVETFTPLPVWEIDQIAEFLTTGFHEGSGGQAHQFNVTPGGEITVNVTALNAAGQYLARQALTLWSDIIGVTFVEVTGGGQISFDDNQAGAYANVYQNEGTISHSHVNIEAGRLITFGSTIGSYSFQNYIHEIGHALGLGHAGFYPFGPADPYTDALFANDARSTTAMSYFPQDVSMYFSEQGFSDAFLVTPMIADVAAMKMLYGLSTTTRAGDTIYGFNSNAGRDVFNASMHPDKAYTVFDSGGVDTLDYSGFSASQVIKLVEGAYSNVGGLAGNVVIALGTVIENAVGGAGNDELSGNAANNRLNGGGGNDTLSGGFGSDTLIGGSGTDMFRGTGAELSGDTITDFAAGDHIVITDADVSAFTHSLSGSILTYSGGALTFGSTLAGTVVATAAAGGGVQLVFAAGPPPPPPVARAKLILTEGGQDAIVGGNVAVLGTTAAGEVIEVVRGDVSLDASFNAGGDTVVLSGEAGDYTAVLKGSFVTLAGSDVSVASPVGLVGLSVQFGNSTRQLRIESGKVMLGDQQVAATEQAVAAFGPVLADPAETGPNSFAKLILTAGGQDVDIGGNVAVTGTSASGEVISVLGGNVRLDASFNAGGDTVVLPGTSSAYAARLTGSFVTLTDGDISVAIPAGVNGLTVDFTDVSLSLRIEGGQVRLGDQVVTSTAGPVQSAALLDHGFALADRDGADRPLATMPQLDLDAPYRLEFSDSFSFA